MNHFLVNGVEKPIPVKNEESFGNLIQYIHSHLSGEQTMISSIRVDGIEINEQDEHDLAEVSLDRIGSVEVIFRHPKEFAEETLQTLNLFIPGLIDLSRKAALEEGNTQPFANYFSKLLDGIQTFVDTIRGVKSVLKIGLLNEVNILEADLASIMKDLLEAQEKPDFAYRKDLLATHLPVCLKDWVDTGMPALIRARDS